MNLEAALNALTERVARLESARPRKRVYNQAEAAREVGVSISKFRAEQRAGRIRGTLNGRVWCFTDQKLERYVRGDPPL
jgi:hypothetical protein